MSAGETGLSPSEALFVSRLRVAHLATRYPDGRPHVVPISPVLDLDRLVFASERDTQKVRNLQTDPSVAVCFDEYSEVWDSLQQVIVHGGAYMIETGFEFRRARELLYDKYRQYETDSPIEEDTSVIVELRIDRVASWGF